MTKSRTSTRTPNRVLGIDPGFDRLGWAVLEKGNARDTIIASGCIVTNRSASPAERLHTIGADIEAVIQQEQPDTLAIEKLFFNQNVSTGIRVAEARGVILYEAARAALPVCEYSPQEVKLAVTGYGKASKRDLLRMLGLLVALPRGKRLDDELDAIALGITHLASRRQF